MELFGDLLRRLRTEAGMTQQELADELGKTQGYITAMERGQKVNPGTEVVMAISNVFQGRPSATLNELMEALSRSQAEGRRVKSKDRKEDEATAELLQFLTSDLPVLGPVAAGPGVEVEDADIETKNLAGHGLLVVRGESLNLKGIRDGHKVVVKFGPGWKAGDLVVARVRKGFVIKKANKKGNAWWLEPACDDPKIHAVKCDRAAGVEVIGTVVGVLWG